MFVKIILRFSETQVNGQQTKYCYTVIVISSALDQLLYKSIYGFNKNNHIANNKRKQSLDKF